MAKVILFRNKRNKINEDANVDVQSVAKKIQQLQNQKLQLQTQLKNQQRSIDMKIQRFDQQIIQLQAQLSGAGVQQTQTPEQIVANNNANQNAGVDAAPQK